MELLSDEMLLDKMHGCFLGKEIGHTLGEPFNSKIQLNDVDFYTDMSDDIRQPFYSLEFDFIWLVMAEYYGPEHLTLRHFGEYLLSAYKNPWCEFACCYKNCHEGLLPPLSGSCENDHLGNAVFTLNRSGFWACLCAGRPDEVIRFAWMNSSCDHCKNGIYAETFTAAIEAAAFYCTDLYTLILIGLSKIPDGHLSKTIELTIAGYDARKDWKSVRREIMEYNADIGISGVENNVPFAVLALLYGQGDFGKSLCLAVNCGDFPSYTASIVGTVLGIIQGAKALPEKWKKHYLDNTMEIFLNRFGLPLPIPKSVTELTLRIQRLRKMAELRDPQTALPAKNFFDTKTAEELWHRSEYELQFNLLFITVSVDYPNGPYAEPGKTIPIRLRVRDGILQQYSVVKMRWLLPEGWDCATPEMSICTARYNCDTLETTVTPPNKSLSSMSYLYLEVTTAERKYPDVITIPLKTRMAILCKERIPDPVWSSKFLIDGHKRAIEIIENKRKDIIMAT